MSCASSDCVKLSQRQISLCELKGEKNDTMKKGKSIYVNQEFCKFQNTIARNICRKKIAYYSKLKFDFLGINRLKCTVLLLKFSLSFTRKREIFHIKFVYCLFTSVLRNKSSLARLKLKAVMLQLCRQIRASAPLRGEVQPTV